jgi:gamma-glutamylcyclotransferase (GGCT)/AIG2-like uncharacterized protein YtfP
MTSLTSHRLFVYSSLRKGFHQHAYDYVTKFFSFVCTAKVEGILNDLGNMPVATPAGKNTFIKGELYELNNQAAFSWVFGQLDDYEGLIATQDEQPLYRRELTTIYKDDGTVTDAWIYWYNGDVSGKPVIDSGDVFEYQESKNL